MNFDPQSLLALFTIGGGLLGAAIWIGRIQSKVAELSHGHAELKAMIESSSKEQHENGKALARIEGRFEAVYALVSRHTEAAVTSAVEAALAQKAPHK